MQWISFKKKEFQLMVSDIFIQERGAFESYRKIKTSSLNRNPSISLTAQDAHFLKTKGL
jgi:hypothetical protein